MSPRESLMEWLERNGRFLVVDNNAFQDQKPSESLDDFLDPEIQESEDEEESDD